jgi:hypothetical protein
VVWHPKPKIEPSGLDIGGACGKALDNVSGRLEAAGERLLTRLGGLEPRIHEGWAVWHPKPKIKPSRLNISGACGKALDNVTGRLEAVGERPLTRLGGLEPRIHEGWAVWHPKLKINALGLDIGGTCRKPLDSGSGGLEVAGKGPLQRPGGLEPGYMSGGQFGARNQKLMRLGSISVRPPENRTPTIAVP